MTSANQAKEVLEKVMAIAQMPLELTGNVSQTRELINQFSDNLAPDHVFWQEFAEVVQLAFPAESMAADNLLAHQIHQFRYVILPTKHSGYENIFQLKMTVYPC